jgi:hypothetical protein
MALDLYMLGLVVEDMGRSLDFYRRLGLAVPDEADGQTHVQIPKGCVVENGCVCPVEGPEVR